MAQRAVTCIREHYTLWLLSLAKTVTYLVIDKLVLVIGSSWYTVYKKNSQFITLQRHVIILDMLELLICESSHINTDVELYLTVEAEHLRKSKTRNP